MCANINIFFNNNILNKNKLRESWVINNLPELYKSVIEFDDSEIKFSNFFNKIKEPLCDYCCINKKRFIGFKDGYDKFCSKKCASKNSLPTLLEVRRKNTFEKYGGNDCWNC